LFLRVRPGGLLDIHGISEAYAEVWKSTYAGIAPEMFVKGMTVQAAKQIFHESLQPNQYSYFLHVAETDDGKIVGFADGGKERSHPEKGIGELYAIYLLKEFQNQGLGRKLLKAATKSLIQSGINSMVVWVLQNSPNKRFYESTGGKLQTGVKTLDVAGHPIVLISYFWEKLTPTAF
jgi:GNAT superfamily N-acetyltransferase